MKETKNTGLQGTRLPPIKRNGAALLDKFYRDMLIAAANALFNLEVIIPSTDGENFLSSQKAKVEISELSMRIILPPSSSSSSSSGSVPFSGSGAPAAGTLSSSSSYLAGPVPSIYVDMTGFNLWVCTTAGTNSTSVWTQISGGGGGSGGCYMSTYNNTLAYAVGSIVRVLSTASYSGTASVPGVYGCKTATAANGTGNEVPQYPEPTSGTVYWELISPALPAISNCPSGTTIYVAATNPF
jgi:hypothetical protein